MSDIVLMEDLGQLKELMEEEFDSLVSMFAEDSYELINKIQVATSEESYENLRIAAHTLKGSSSNMCAKALSEISHKIEDKAKAQDLTGIDELLTNLLDVHAQSIEILKAF